MSAPVRRRSDADSWSRSAAGRWTVDRGPAGFTVRDKLLATVRGTLPVVDGGVTVGDDGRIVHAWVRLDVVGVATGNAHRDRTLARPALLDTGRFPALTITVTAGSVADSLAEQGCVVEATALAKGVLVPVRLTATVVGEPNPDVVRVRVTGRLDRRPLGIRAPSVVIGRWVGLDAELTFRRAPAGDER